MCVDFVRLHVNLVKAKDLINYFIYDYLTQKSYI